MMSFPIMRFRCLNDKYFARRFILAAVKSGFSESAILLGRTQLRWRGRKLEASEYRGTSRKRELRGKFVNTISISKCCRRLRLPGSDSYKTARLAHVADRGVYCGGFLHTERRERVTTSQRNVIISKGLNKISPGTILIADIETPYFLISFQSNVLY